MVRLLRPLALGAALVGCMTPLYEGSRVEPGWHGAVGAAYLHDVPLPVGAYGVMGPYELARPMNATRLDVSGVYGFDDRLGLTLSAGGGYGVKTVSYKRVDVFHNHNALSSDKTHDYYEYTDTSRYGYLGPSLSGYTGLKWNAVRANPSLALKGELGWPVPARLTALLGWAWRGHEIATLGVQTALTFPTGVFVVLHRKVTARHELHLFLGHDLTYVGAEQSLGYAARKRDFVVGIGVGW